MCGYACRVGRGGIHGDGACAHDEDGGRCEDDLKAMVVLSVVYVVEVGAFICLPIVDHRRGDVVAKGYDVTGNVDRAEVGFNGTNFV